jgi:hypothetical protein
MGFSSQCYFATLADHKEPVLPALAVDLKMAALKTWEIFHSLKEFEAVYILEQVGPLSSYCFLHTLPFLIFEWPFEEVEQVLLEFHPAK